MESVDEREARYAEVIGRLYLTTSGGGVHSIEDVARAVVALADAEIEAVASTFRADQNEMQSLCLSWMASGNTSAELLASEIARREFAEATIARVAGLREELWREADAAGGDDEDGEDCRLDSCEVCIRSEAAMRIHLLLQASANRGKGTPSATTSLHAERPSARPA